jgi:hypothetical protein
MTLFEVIGRDSMIFFPHDPFSRSSVHAFISDSSDYGFYVSMQGFDICLFLAIAYLIENYSRIRKGLRAFAKGEKVKGKY